MSEAKDKCCGRVEISEPDILEAMKEIQGYIDISPGDFKEVFQVAYARALQRIQNALKARDIMSRPVHCIGHSMNLMQTAAFLADKGISGAPVVDAEGRVVGVVSEKDFLAKMGLGKSASFMQVIAHCLQNKGCMVTALHNHFIQDIMTTPAITAGPEITIGAISALFVDRQINRLPIVDREGRIVGIVTRTDLVQSNIVPR